MCIRDRSWTLPDRCIIIAFVSCMYMCGSSRHEEGPSRSLLDILHTPPMSGKLKYYMDSSRHLLFNSQLSRRRSNCGSRRGGVEKGTPRAKNATKMTPTATPRVENAGGVFELFSFFIFIFLYALLKNCQSWHRVHRDTGLPRSTDAGGVYRIHC